MRTEFVVVVTDKGKTSVSRYGGKKWADEKYNALLRMKTYMPKKADIEIAMYKEHYIGNSIHDRERLL